MEEFLRGVPDEYLAQNIGGFGDLTSIFLNVFFGAAISISLISIILSGIKYITSASGNPKELEATRKSLTFSIVALVLSISAFAIMKIIGSLVGLDNPEELLNEVNTL